MKRMCPRMKVRHYYSPLHKLVQRKFLKKQPVGYPMLNHKAKRQQ
jgi:hypothetical protein